MAVETVRGAEQLAALSRALKQAGNKEFQKELTKGIRTAVTPLKRKLPASALTTLPRKGGLAAKTARSRFTVTRRTSARNPGLRLTGKGAYDLARMDAGTVRHPVFERRGSYGRTVRWAKQRIKPGWFTKPVEREVPEIRRQIMASMGDIIQKIERSV